MFHEKIYKSVQQEKTKLLDATEEHLRYSKLKHLCAVGSLLVGLAIYCVVITILWLVDHSEPLKTIPDWFTSRGENLNIIWEWVKSFYLWGYNLLEPRINDLVAKGISFIITTAIVCLVAYIVFKAISWIWFEISISYNNYDTKLLRYSSSASIMAISIPLAIVLVEVIPLALNIVSWWLILSILLNLTYYKITNTY